MQESNSIIITMFEELLARNKRRKCTKNGLFSFMEDVIEQQKTLGKIRTSETYTASLYSFKRFRKNRDVSLDEMDADLMVAYEVYLRNCGVSLNTSSFYMRNLRAVYNRAVEKELTLQLFLEVSCCLFSL